jgi:predicted RNA-binding protein with EMAP domain
MIKSIGVDKSEQIKQSAEQPAEQSAEQPAEQSAERVEQSTKRVKRLTKRDKQSIEQAKHIEQTVEQVKHIEQTVEQVKHIEQTVERVEPIVEHIEQIVEQVEHIEQIVEQVEQVEHIEQIVEQVEQVEHIEQIVEQVEPIVEHIEQTVEQSIAPHIQPINRSKHSLYMSYIEAKHQYMTSIEQDCKQEYADHIAVTGKTYDLARISQSDVSTKEIIDKYMDGHPVEPNTETKQLYKRLSLIYHPDKLPDHSQEVMQLLNESYELNDRSMLKVVDEFSKNCGTGDNVSVARILNHAKMIKEISSIEQSVQYAWKTTGHDFGGKITKNEYLDDLLKQKAQLLKNCASDQNIIDQYKGLLLFENQPEETIKGYNDTIDQYKESINRTNQLIDVANNLIEKAG